MKPEQITETLEQAAAQLGVQVRYDTMTGDAAGGGGLCKVKGTWWVIMDRKMPPADRAAMLIDALAGFDTDSVFLPPQVRDAIAAKRSERASARASSPSESSAREASPSEAAPSDTAPSEAAPSEAAPSDAAPSDAAPSDAPPSEAPPAT